MSNALPLPPDPHIEEYKKRAEDLQRAGAFQTVADGETFVAREHGFASWPRFVAHLEGLAVAGSPISNFEAAVEAIIVGDAAALSKLLHDHPDLVQARSTRDHLSTVLHYISANGVEDFRQKTPRNIVEIANLLLTAGADVNAESDAYGGRSTTLGLTATSVHPENAGVQLALLQLLIDHAATINGPDGGSAVNSALHNGRGQAAAFLASRGARLDLEGAAGVGRLDIVRHLWTLATPQQKKDGFAWACALGRTPVVEFFLEHGLEAGHTGLHWAALHGEVDTVQMLLDRNAAVDVKDETFNATPLGWALNGWKEKSGDRFHRVAALLVAAGSKVEPEWLLDPKIHADPEMLAALNTPAQSPD